MDLVHEMTYDALLRPPRAIGDGPFGNRLYPGFGVDIGSTASRDGAPGGQAGTELPNVMPG
jgi:hypothetical protein